MSSGHAHPGQANSAGSTSTGRPTSTAPGAKPPRASDVAPPYEVPLKVTPPEQLDNLEEYDLSRLKQGKQFAVVAIQYEQTHRKFSPMSKYALNQYLNVCERGLACKSRDEATSKGVWKDMHYYEKTLCRKPAFWKHEPEHDWLAEKLNRGQYIHVILKYGDYAGECFKEMKALAQTDKELRGKLLFPLELKNKLATDANEQLEKERSSWEPIHKQLQDEKATWSKHGTSLGSEPVKLSFTIWQIALKSNVPYKHLAGMIDFYAERNRQAHSDLQEHLVLGERAELGKMLWQDWQWIHENWPLHDHELRQFRALLLWWLHFKLKEWYNLDPYIDDEPGDWRRVNTTDKLWDLMKTVRAKSSADRQADGDAKAAEVIAEQNKVLAQTLAEVVYKQDPFTKYLLCRAFANDGDPQSLRPTQAPTDLRAELFKLAHPTAGNSGSRRGNNGKGKEDAGIGPSSAPGPSSTAILGNILNPLNPKNFESLARRQTFDAIMAKKEHIRKPKKDLQHTLRKLIILQHQVELAIEDFYDRFDSYRRDDADEDPTLGLGNLDIAGQ